MSNPFYNPYAPGNKSSTQGQYGHSNTQTERDPRRAPSFHGPSPTFSSSGTFPMIPEHSLNYRPEPSRAIRDEDAQSSMDMHIGRAREELRPPSNPVHQPMDQGSRFTSTQMEDFRSPGTGRAPYPMASTPASLGHRREMDLESSSGTMNWSKNYARPSDAGSSLKSASGFSKYASSDDGRLNDPEDRERDLQHIPGLGDYDFPASSKPGSSIESSQPMYTSESAATILLRFGLEKEDLEHLIAYPEDQITPANLPFILRQIRLEKDKKAATAAQSSPYLEPQPNRTVTGPSNYSLNSPGGALMQPEETVSAVLQPSKVIDYGHTGKYMTEVGDEFGLKSDRDGSSGSGSVFMSREPLQKSTTECKSSTLGSSSEQASPFPGLSSSYGSLRPAPFSSKDQPPMQPKQTFQDILSSFSLLKKDTDISIRKPEASNPVPLSQPEVDRHLTLKTQQPPAQSHGLHPSRPGLVLIGNTEAGGTKNPSKTPGQSPQHPVQQAQKQPPKQAQKPSTKPAQKQPAKKQPQQQSKKQTQQPQKHPASQKGQAKRSPVYGRSASPADADQRQKAATSKRPAKDKAAVSKDQPTPEMMRDYAAAPPKKFPHICVLCNTECTDMKDWITHQNSSFHLESCRLLRKQYPKWDGEIVLGPRVAGKTATASTSSKKGSHGSHSHSKSISPHRQPGPEGRRDKRRSRSRSPQSPRYNRRYDLPSTSSYRSRSQSPGRRKDDRQSSPRRTRERRSPLRRSNESPSPPRRVDNRWSPPRRISDAWLPPRKGDGIRSPPRRSADSGSPPRRADDRWTPPKRFDKGRSPPRRLGEKWSPPRRSEGSRSPSGRNQERRTSREGSSPPRKKPNNAENLAKKLLETSGVQSLSNKSDLEAVVKSLAPVLFAELAKMKSSSPSSLAKGGKSSTPSSSAKLNKSSLSSKPSSSSSMAKAKVSTAASLKAKTNLQKNEVKLDGIHKNLSHDDVVAALERYGKTKSVLLYRSTEEAVVNFEKEEAANKLRALKYVDVKGTAVAVVRARVALTKKQVRASSLKSAATKVQTKTTTGRKTLLPTPKIPPLMGPLFSGARRGAPGKVVNQKTAAKGSANVARAVSKAKVLVSKAKNVLSPSSAKTAATVKLPAKGQEKAAAAKQEKSFTPQQKKPDTGDTKGQPISVLTGVKRPAVMLKDTLERDRSVKELPKASSSSSQIQAVSAVQKTPLDKVSGTKTNTSASVTPKSQNPPHGESSKPTHPESKESVEGSKDTAESGKASPPTMVKLHGIQKSVSHSDVLSAVAKFGKTKSIVLFRARSEAVVIFEKEEDAKKLKSVKSLTVNGMEITIVGESSISPTTETAKELVVGQKETLAREAKATAKNDAKGNQSGLENSKHEESKAQGSLKVSEDTAKAADGANLPGKTKVGKADKADDEPVELGVTEVKDAELVDAAKGKEMTSKEAAPGQSPEKPSESQPPTSSVQQSTLIQRPGTGSSQVQQQAAGNSGAALEAKIARGVTESTPQGLVPAVTTPLVKDASVMKPESSNEKLPTAEDGTKTCVMEDPTKTEASGNQPDTELLSVPETPTDSVEITGVGVKDIPDGEKSAISMTEVEKSVGSTVDELAKQPVVKDVVLASQAEMVLPEQEPKAQEEKPGESGAEAVRNTETQPPGESLKPDQPETKVEGSLEASKVLAEVAEKADVPSVEDKDQEKVVKADEVDEPMELGETGPMELMESGICTEDRGTDGAEAVPEKQPESRTEASQVKEQAAGSAADAAVQQDVLSGGTASKTQKVTAKAEGSSKTVSKVKTTPASAVGSKQKPASKKPSAAVIQPTIGEMLEKHLFPQSIHCLQSPHISPSSYNQQLLICNLPTYHDGLYTEDDVANLLAPFGFKNKQENLYVIPQTCMAFATMSSIGNVYDILKESQHNGIFLKENRLSIKIIRLRYQMKVLQFYRFLKRLMKCYLLDEGGRTFLIRNISSSKIRELRQALEDFGPVSNFMPLLNKLFLEFECVEDAARFEGWYSLLGQAPGCKVIKLNHIAPSAALTTQSDTSAKDANLTFGERLEHHLTKQIIASLKRKNATTPKMLITWLPAYEEGCYTEDDIVELLTPFGYQHKDHNIYVVPQACLAFVQMPSTGKVSDILRASKKDPILLKESKLSFHPMDDVISMSPFRFYKSLMELVKYRMKGDRDGVILIRDISPSETRDLREVLERHGSVKNFLPLLNKVFIEFKTCRDADWLGVWYSLLKQPPSYRIQRLKIPTGCHIPPAPQFPNDTLLDRDDLVEGATLPGVKVFLPQISPSPFWISLRNSPFVFPTISPWFVIPMFKTVIGTFSIEKATRQGSLCPTIMLTGLPEGNYKHEDVARMVWPYFTKQNLQSLYYNVTVLPLQRRAFVYFADWAMCCEFVQAHIAKRLVFKRKKIGVHFVTQNMYPESSEEKMYRNMMMWSNAGVPDPMSLEDRLLCVEVSEVSLDVITLVIEMVASITTFVNFLPLGNRICIEMTDSNGVTQVVEKYNDPSTKSFREDPVWSKVKNFESVESLKKRLQDSGETIINLESDLISGDEMSPEMDKDLLKAITVTVGQQRLVQKGRSQGVERQGQDDDFTEDNISSEAFPDAYLFDEEQFNEDEFVTVDEVYDDAEDKSSESRRHSSSRHSSRKRPSSSASSSRQQSSTRSSKDHTSTSSSSSSRSSKGSRPSNSSSDLKNSSKPTKSSSKSSSSSSASKATSSCPPKSTATLSSVDKKTQHSSTKSLVKSSSASEREKHASTASQKASLDTEKGKVEADDTESAVVTSDHTVSALGPAAETVESETKIETTREMHPPQQEHGLDLNQTQDMEHDLNANKDKVESQEEEEEDGKQKGLEEVHSNNRQTASSSDGQTDKQMQDGGQDGSSTLQLTGSEGGQVLDGVKVEGKAHPEGEREMDIESPLLREGATKDEEATSQEDSGLVIEDCLTLKQPSKEDVVPVADKSDDKIQEINKENNPIELDTGGKETQTSKGEEKNTTQDEKEVEGKATKEAGNLQGETPNEDQPNKDDTKESDSEQDAFEILDSIDDQAEGEKFETSSVEASKDDKIPVDEGEYQVIDSVEVQATTTENENKQRRSKRGEAIAKKDDRPSRRGGPSSKASKSETEEEFTSKQAKTVKKNQARTKIDTKEEIVFEIVDSVEEEQVEEPDRARESTGRRRSTRGKKEEKPEEVTYKVLDSVENEMASDEPAISTRSTRGRRGRTTEEALKEETPTRKRQTPARESKSREKTPKKEAKAQQEITPSKESIEERSEEAATYEILDSVEEEVINDDKPATRGKGKRGRPKKEVKSTRKDDATPRKVDKEASEKEASEEVSTFEILDSVEDESNNDRVPSDQSGSARDENIPTNKDEEKGVTENEEEEPLFQIVDSLEDDAVQEETTVSKDESKTKDESPREEAEKDGDTCSEEPEKLVVGSLRQTADDLKEINEDSSILEGSGPQDKERTPKSDSLIKSQSDTVVLDKETEEKSPEKEQTTSVLVNLDEVSDEEEDYPDDTAEEEELRKRQAAKEKQLAIKQEVRSTRERERRSRSNSSKGGEDDGGSRRGKKRGREEEKGEVDSQELVTLDEVGADEAKDEKVPEGQELEEEAAEGEAQTLVTLDEFVEDEAEGQDEESKLEDQRLNQEDKSAEDLNQETLVTLDEACYDEEEPQREAQGKTALKSAKRKHDDDDTEESMNFVIVDEVKDEEKGETSTSRTKGRPKKKGRQTPVRKSTRGNNVSTQEENEEENAQTDELPPSSLEASSSLSKSLTKLTTEGELEAQRTAEAEATSQSNKVASSAEIGEEEKEERSRVDMKVVSKQRREHDGPEAKRSRSQSPSVPSDFKLPEFKPNNPLGKEFVVPGYFCSLCSVFYKNENTAKELHCSSQKHFNKLQKHYQELQQKSRSSTPSQGSFSE
ncbi:uncharacterized protein LOC121504624 isoform X2 [Cheilinus undulatus]|uniref:uncharacterized protein LOC121504624 isoform X2 n=1 Tax=Cheilinus undulatus TaxID=241271 RepID=UPI001BD4C2E5|nr:uncharacterized protein LOC121504624 isoform X2 [Cheilinus undulatus]